jgi:hypothetical protein
VAELKAASAGSADVESAKAKVRFAFNFSFFHSFIQCLNTLID